MGETRVLRDNMLLSTLKYFPMMGQGKDTYHSYSVLNWTSYQGH